MAERDEQDMYIVKEGDTLSQISEKMYGTPSLYPVIFEANSPPMRDENNIWPGQQLIIPRLNSGDEEEEEIEEEDEEEEIAKPKDA